MGRALPEDLSTWKIVPVVVVVMAEEPLPTKRVLAVKEVAPVPPWATVTAALEVRILAEASGRVKVFSEVVGPLNLAKPLPVPPLPEVSMPVISLLPDKREMAPL